MRERQTETDRDRDRDTETDRQTDRDIQTDRLTGRQADRQTDRDRQNTGTVSKATLWKLLRDGVEHIWAFLSA